MRSLRSPLDPRPEGRGLLAIGLLRRLGDSPKSAVSFGTRSSSNENDFFPLSSFKAPRQTGSIWLYRIGYAIGSIGIARVFQKVSIYMRGVPHLNSGRVCRHWQLATWGNLGSRRVLRRPRRPRARLLHPAINDPALFLLVLGWFPSLGGSDIVINFAYLCIPQTLPNAPWDCHICLH